MKKSYLFIAAFAAVSLVACQKEKEVSQEATLTTISAVAANADTKAYVDGLQVKWSAGDHIAVADEDDANVDFTLSSGAGTTSATFQGNLGGKALGTYAVYPYSGTETFDTTNDLVNMEYLPYWDYPISPVPMYGVNDGSGSYDFNIIGGAIQVSYSNIPVTANVKFFQIDEISDTPKNITGGISLDFSSNPPTVTPALDFATVWVNNIPADATDVTLIIPIPAGTGYKFQIGLYEFGESDPIPGSVKTASNRTVNEGKILRFPEIDLTPVIPSGTYAIVAKNGDNYYAMANTHNDNLSRLDEKAFTDGSTTTDDQSIVWTFTSVANVSTIEDSAGKYLKASSSNDANVDDDSQNNTITKVSDGIYTIVQSGRYLSRNDSSKGFAFYGNTGQNEELYVVPITYVPLASWAWGAGDTEIDADDEDPHDIAVTTDATSVSVVVKNEDESAEITWMIASFDDSDPANKVITYTAEENTGTSARKAVIVVTATNAYGNKDYKITITQSGTAPAAPTYTWTLANSDLGTTDSPATSITKGTLSTTSAGIAWDADFTWGGSSYLGYDSTKGVQIGKATKNNVKGNCTSFELSTDEFTAPVTKVVINGSIASSGNAVVSVSVNGVNFKCSGNNTASLTTTATDYTFTGAETGTIVITVTNSAEKAFYLKTIKINTD